MSKIQVEINMERNISNTLGSYPINFPCNKYKGVIHRGNCTKNKLSNDIEKNPGPGMHHVDPSKKIKAPYRQGDVVVFGQNSGQQCAAMSLCELIYDNMKGIGNPDGLKQIMHIGNQLHSSRTQLSRQSFLLLAFTINSCSTRKDYQLEYSESYTSNVHGEPTVEGYQYCMDLKRAFEPLISERYLSFI